MKDLTTKATNGELNTADAQDAMSKAGMDVGAMNDAISKLERLRDEAIKKGKNPGGDQNGSGSADWNMGQVYRDRDYRLSMPLENNCRIAQTVTIQYPTSILLDGPKSIVIPPKSKLDVPLTLTMTQPPIPMPPWPPGANFQCYDLKGAMTLTHPELKQVTSTATGKYTYVCHEMKRTYTIQMHVHSHHPPEPPNNNGGGGGPEKKKHPACQTLWSSHEFYPSKDASSPEACRGEIHDLAKAFFGDALATFRSGNPSAWAWVPSASQIDTMAVDDLLKLKARADDLARSR